MTSTAHSTRDATWGSVTGGQRAMEELAPEAARAFAALEQAAWHTGAADLLGKAALVCSANLGLPTHVPPALTRPGGTGSVEESPAEAVALEFADQFSVDVASTSEAMQARLGAALGALTGPYVQGLYVVDFFPRTRAVLDALFGPSDPADLPPLSASGPDGEDLWDAAMHFLRVVALLDGLDPLTAELVRLRGASQHQCRLCKSVRNRSALEAGGNDELYAAVDRTEMTGLSDAQRAAVALADAMIWTPGHLPVTVIDEIRRQFSPAGAVTLVLWITRNSSNKIAVALAADTPHVTDGVEIYDLDETGEPVYGLSST
jgi:alkylhydroperoxidase family enzyme